MTERNNQPWATGPAEILKHGLDLLTRESDTNRRLAIISIDNSVELMIKTYLSLPRRITGLTISRREISDASESFPKLLDALEIHAEAKIDGINLGEIEWYHRLRNELYHQGNGLTVERDKVEVYSELAKLLFKNLFGVELLPDEAHSGHEILGSFMWKWAHFERRLHAYASDRNENVVNRTLHHRYLLQNLLTEEELKDLDMIRTIRNQVVHGAADYSSVITPELIAFLDSLISKIPTPPAAPSAG